MKFIKKLGCSAGLIIAWPMLYFIVNSWEGHKTNTLKQALNEVWKD